MRNTTTVNSHHDLEVWRVAIELAVATVKATERFPPRERSGLSNQLRRASFSIASNIAEGAAQGTRRSYAHFIAISRGSASELRTGFLIASRCGWISANDHQVLDTTSVRVSQMLTVLHRRLAGP